MAEEHEKLRRSLDELVAQLDELRQIDPAVAEQLGSTIADAQAALAGKPPGGQRSLVDELHEAVLKYEASHPTLAGNLGSVIDALGRMGI